MEDEKIIDLYWNRDQGAIRHTAEKYGSYCGRIAKNIRYKRESAKYIYTFVSNVRRNRLHICPFYRIAVKYQREEARI